MLKQRVITALALLVVLFGVLTSPSVWAFPVFMTLLVGAAAWEWGRLSGFDGLSALGCAVLAVLGCMAIFLGNMHRGTGNALIWLITVWTGVWLFGAAWLLRAGIPAWQRIPRLLRLIMGLVSLWMAWLAAVYLYERQGAWYLLSVMAVVWMADMAAYFVGRTLGRHKLAPRISPGKTWEGATGGMVGVLLLVFCMVPALQGVENIYGATARHAGWVGLLGLAAAMTVLGVMGDLVESLMKRGMNMKDSSNLLPGHGGVLDRVDSLLLVLPLALAATLWMHR